MRPNDYYRTADLALSTALSLWYPLESVDKLANSRKAEFVFRRDDQLDQLVEAYWRGDLQVEPQRYFAQLRAIKARLYG